jgi:subtilase family serine protease
MRMSRFAGLTAVAASTLTVAGLIAGAGSAVASTAKPGTVTLAGSSPSFTAQAKVIGSMAAAEQLSIQLWLKPDIAGAQRYANAASTPGTALFRHYLSPSAYTARFGPTRAQAGAVESWLRGQGFSSVQADAQRDYVRATAPAATIDQALRVTLKLYRPSAAVNGGPFALYANDRPVTLPASIAADVLGISGLDDAAVTQPLIARPAVTASKAAPCSQYFGQYQQSGLPEKFGTPTFYTYGCGYNAGQIRAGYGMNKANTGQGQTVALVELGLVKSMFLTLSDWAQANHLRAPSASRYEEIGLGRVSQCGSFDVEEQLDVEAAYAMAPASNQIVMGANSCQEGDAGLQGLMNADIAVLNGVDGHPLATITSNSWGISTESAPGQLLSVAHAYFVRAAAEGVGMYFASGDFPGVEFPTDPYAISVGGTSLALGQHNQRLFETGWSTGLLFHTKTAGWGPDRACCGTSGGTSQVFSQPGYQRGVVPASLSTVAGHTGAMRVVPDVSALADPFNGMMVGLLDFRKGQKPKFVLESIGGTSLASPLVAGMIADAQQGQPEPFGFTNPVFYSVAGTSAFHDALPLTSSSPKLYRAEVCPAGPLCFGTTALATFDDQSPAMHGYTGQVTLKGYDDTTGIGTPNGQAFINALRLAEPPSKP